MWEVSTSTAKRAAKAVSWQRLLFGMSGSSHRPGSGTMTGHIGAKPLCPQDDPLRGGSGHDTSWRSWCSCRLDLLVDTLAD